MRVRGRKWCVTFMTKIRVPSRMDPVRTKSEGIMERTIIQEVDMMAWLLSSRVGNMTDSEGGRVKCTAS